MEFYGGCFSLARIRRGLFCRWQRIELSSTQCTRCRRHVTTISTANIKKIYEKKHKWNVCLLIRIRKQSYACCKDFCHQLCVRETLLIWHVYEIEFIMFTLKIKFTICFSMFASGVYKANKYRCEYEHNITKRSIKRIWFHANVRVWSSSQTNKKK